MIFLRLASSRDRAVCATCPVRAPPRSECSRVPCSSAQRRCCPRNMAIAASRRSWRSWPSPLSSFMRSPTRRTSAGKSVRANRTSTATRPLIGSGNAVQRYHSSGESAGESSTSARPTRSASSADEPTSRRVFASVTMRRGGVPERSNWSVLKNGGRAERPEGSNPTPAAQQRPTAQCGLQQCAVAVMGSTRKRNGRRMMDDFPTRRALGSVARFRVYENVLVDAGLRR
jgi:hypothetical protein